MIAKDSQKKPYCQHALMIIIMMITELCLNSYWWSNSVLLLILLVSPRLDRYILMSSSDLIYTAIRNKSFLQNFLSFSLSPSHSLSLSLSFFLSSERKTIWSLRQFITYFRFLLKIIYNNEAFQGNLQRLMKCKANLISHDERLVT